jgi:predicted NUDIX family phosphoesterase
MEFVYAVPRERLFPEFYPQGLRAFGDGFACADFLRMSAQHGYFVERDHAERDPSLKQLIPYAVICCDGRILLTRRTRRGSEARLFDKLSIGIGGHVEPIDLEGARARGSDARQELYATAARREIEEELFVEAGGVLEDNPGQALDIEPVGILNDDSNPVGAVHVGLVLRVLVHGSVRIRESELLEGRLVAPDELRSLLREGANFESWSASLVPHLDSLLALPAALST